MLGWGLSGRRPNQNRGGGGHRHSYKKASQVLAAGHGVPKTPAGPDGVSCLQILSGASCCPRAMPSAGPGDTLVQAHHRQKGIH